MKKIKLFLEAAVVISVVLALVLPGTAVFTNKTIVDEKPMGGATQAIVNDFQKLKLADYSLPRDNIIFPVEGDDILPSICHDPEGRTVVTWTNQISFSESNMNIWYSETPDDPDSWTGWTISLQDTACMYFDTAHIEGPLPTDHNYLMGVYMAMTDEQAGYYEIEDITADASEWLFWLWNDGAPEPEYACIADGGYYQDIYYPDMYGPFNFYIYHEIYSTYDIPGCPIFMHTDIRNDGGGVGFFDGQSFELTAPASEPDYVDLGDRYHTVIQYNDPEGPAKIVWKKTVPAEEPDYEFTPYQDTIATGENPAIAAYDTNVAIVYVYDGDVNCIYSLDDGETWDTSVIDAGEYPDIYAVGDKYYCAYQDDGNLFLTISEDAGATWGSSEQINAVDGTVVDEENSVDINAGGIVWVDESGADYDICYASFEVGSAPAAPTIQGPDGGKAGTPYSYTFTAVDPDGDDVKFIIDWGDDNTETTDFVSSGTGKTVSHTWTEKAVYTITVKAQDSNGLIGPAATKTVNMPRDKSVNMIFQQILERFPNLFPLVKYLFGL